MSFLGGIGNIMAGSGLKEAFTIILAENSADKALAGHAYARSIRAHFLILLALAKIIFTAVELTDEEKALLDSCLKDLGTENFKEQIQKVHFTKIQDKFTHKIEEFEKKGATAKLWVQYWHMATIIRNFIKAERSGNWNLHLKCVEQMLPYFHASGHTKYAKFAHLYLQDMLNLEHEMNEFQYERFTKEGFFTVRRTDKFWSGVWSDMTIEQVLMAGMKRHSGLTHGRGFSETAVATFIATAIVLIDICSEMESFCDVSYVTSDQHVDSRDSRISRDVADLNKLSDFFRVYDPFPETPEIMSIFSGIVGGASINCHNAFEVGIACAKDMVNKNFAEISLKRSAKVLSLKTVNSAIKVDKEQVAVDPLVLFQRICINITHQDDMKQYLKFELAPFPMSMFNENGFRKNVKSQIYSEFSSTDTLPKTDNLLHVIDGGFLLHKVLWSKNSTIQEITERYLNYVQKHYAVNSTIVFDGYSDEWSYQAASDPSATKTAERSRRTKISSVPQLSKWEPQIQVPYTPEKFLTNEKNKNGLIQCLMQQFRSEQYTCLQAKEDADALIINSAIQLAKRYKKQFEKESLDEYNKTIVVVGQDIDLLVLLSQLNSDNLNIYFYKPAAGKVNDCFYSPTSFIHEEKRSAVAFLHCFSGCDTTSALAGKGKKTVFKALMKTPNFMEVVESFYNADSTPDEIAKNGCTFMKSIYKCNDPKVRLNTVRFDQYKSSVSKSTFKLEKIPPTEGAAAQHSFRVYHQVQMWLGNNLNATDWGWKETVTATNKKILSPRFIPVDDSVIPIDLLKTITCQCEKGCDNRCGCRKLLLRCTDLCIKCRENCTNVDTIFDHHDDLDDPEETSDFNEASDIFSTSQDETLNENSDQEETCSGDEDGATSSKRPRLDSTANSSDCNQDSNLSSTADETICEPENSAEVSTDGNLRRSKRRKLK